LPRFLYSKCTRNYGRPDEELKARPRPYIWVGDPRKGGVLEKRRDGKVERWENEKEGEMEGKREASPPQ